MFAVVGSGADHQLVVVVGIPERRAQFIVAVDIDVLGSVLQENPQRFGFHFPHQRWIDMIAAQVGEAADEA